MPYEVTWIIPSRVICSRPGRSITLEDFIERNVRMCEQIRSVDCWVYVILDINQAKSFAIPTASLAEHLTFLNEPNIAMVVLVSKDEMRHVITRNIFSDFPVSLVWQDTVEEAIRYLFEVDPDLYKVPCTPVETLSDQQT